MIEYYKLISDVLGKLKVGYVFRTDEMVKDDPLINLARFLGYSTKSREECAVNLIKLIFRVKKLSRKKDSSTGMFSTEYVIEKVKSVGDFISESLLHHKLKMRDKFGSKCGKHLGGVYVDKKTGEVYDRYNCVKYDSYEAWLNSKRYLNIGESMPCLKKKMADDLRKSFTLRKMQKDGKVEKDSEKVDDLEENEKDDPPD